MESKPASRSASRYVCMFSLIILIGVKLGELKSRDPSWPQRSNVELLTAAVQIGGWGCWTGLGERDSCDTLRKSEFQSTRSSVHTFFKNAVVSSVRACVSSIGIPKVLNSWGW